MPTKQVSIILRPEVVQSAEAVVKTAEMLPDQLDKDRNPHQTLKAPSARGNVRRWEYKLMYIDNFNQISSRLEHTLRFLSFSKCQTLRVTHPMQRFVAS